MSSHRTVPAILPYTLLKIDEVPTLVFLVWRDRKSSALESCTFWGPVVCPQGKDDASARDSVCRLFSEKTKGQFAPAIMVYDNEQDAEVVARKSPAKQKIEESRLAMRKKLVQGNGVTLLSIRQYITYVAPVRFVPAQQLNDAFGADKGEVEWISAQDLFAALYSSVPDNVVTVQAHPYETATTKSAKAVTLPLSLPFTVSMRTREARNELAAILKQFNVSLPIETAPAAAADSSSSSSSSSSSTPDLASLSLHAGGAAAPASVAAAAAASSSSASAATPAAATRAPETNYACRKCRTVLFTDVALSSHTMPANGGGRFAHKHIPVSQVGRKVGTGCSSLFVEPLLLGSGDHPPGEAPLLCQKCNTRYGYYVWSGQQCSCGEWVIPSFQVPKSKVDERPVAGPNRANHVAFHFQRPPPRAAVAAAAAPPAAAPAATAAPAAASDAAAAPASTPAESSSSST